MLKVLSPLLFLPSLLCPDLTEGKFSFPIIHAIRHNPADRRLLNILKRKTEDEDVKRHAIQYMEQVGSFEYTRGIVRALFDIHLTDSFQLKDLSAKIRDMIDGLGHNDKLLELMGMLETIKY